jgi:hypothetical protein
MKYRLIIVTGCMRSGTSLLYALVSTSPDTNSPIAPARYLSDNFHLLKRYLGTDRLFAADYFADRSALIAHARKTVIDVLDAAWEKSGRPLALAIKAAELSSMLPLVAEVVPNARFVVSVREPKDTIASIVKVGERQKSLGLRLFSGRAQRDIGRLCKAYNAAYLSSLRAGDRLAGRLVYVRYEDVVADGAAAMAPVWAHYGIAPGDLTKAENERRTPHFKAVTEHRYWRTYLTELSGRAISASSLGGSRQILGTVERARIDWRCRRVRRTFGYAAS